MDLLVKKLYTHDKNKDYYKGKKIPPWVYFLFVCCECCVFWGVGLCDGLITRPEEPYGVCVRACAHLNACDQVQH
jgi:hypothetical protein